MYLHSYALMQAKPLLAPTDESMVKLQDVLAGREPLDSSGLVDGMETMNLKDDTADTLQGDDLARLKEHFMTKKYTRGKPKGHSHTISFPWIGYFGSLNEQNDRSFAEIFCWVINSETNSAIYHVNAANGDLEHCADGTKSFTAGRCEFLPDVVNRKLYVPGGVGLQDVILGGFEDIKAGCMRYNECPSREAELLALD